MVVPPSQKQIDDSARRALTQTPFPLRARVTAQSILLARVLLRKHGIGEARRKRTVEGVHGPTRDHSEVDPSLMIDVPRIAKKDLTPAKLNAALKAGIPMVLEGAASDSQAVRNWTPEYLRDNYGDVDIPMWAEHSTKEKMPLKECLSNILEDKGDPKIQVNNACSLFSERPELLDELPVRSMGETIKSVRYHGSNIFICRGGNGSKFHCANEVNLFFQVYGEKEWLFVHPRYTPQMDPLFTMPKGNYFASGVEWGQLPSNVPIGRALLKPGDILINPPWWWHWVRNHSTTIGVATRWLAWRHRFGTSNAFFSGLQWLFPHQWKIMWQDYYKGGQLDEHKWVHPDPEPASPKSPAKEPLQH